MTLAPQERVQADSDANQEVARSAASFTRHTLSGQTNRLAILDARRESDRETS